MEVLEMHRGLTYNLKELTLRPNKFVNSYLSGLTKGVMNPFSYTIVILTSLTFILGAIENLSDGLTGFSLLDVTVNWKFFLFFQILLLLFTFIFRLFGRRRLLEAIIEAIFFTTHYVLLICSTLIVKGLIELKWTLQAEYFILNNTSLFSDQLFHILFALVTLVAYFYAFFKPSIRLFQWNFWGILKGVSKVGMLILTLIILFVIIDFGIYASSIGGGVVSSDSQKMKEAYSNWVKLNLRSERQVQLNNFLLKFDSLDHVVSRQVSFISQRLDSLESYILKDTLNYRYNVSDWMNVRVNYSYVLDESINPHLSILKQYAKEFNDLLNKNDSTSLNYEINFSEMKTKPNAEVLHYFEGKKQEILMIESLFILNSIDDKKNQFIDR